MRAAPERGCKAPRSIAQKTAPRITIAIVSPFQPAANARTNVTAASSKQGRRTF
jgi:hypothetical protein